MATVGMNDTNSFETWTTTGYEIHPLPSRWKIESIVLDDPIQKEEAMSDAKVWEVVITQGEMVKVAEAVVADDIPMAVARVVAMYSVEKSITPPIHEIVWGDQEDVTILVRPFGKG